jgi:hypothetical protein
MLLLLSSGLRFCNHRGAHNFFLPSFVFFHSQNNKKNKKIPGQKDLKKTKKNNE